MRMVIVSLVALLPSLATTSIIQKHFGHVPLKEILEGIAKMCERKTGATKDDMKLLHDYDILSTTRESKCMVACVLHFLGSINEADESEDKVNLDLYFTFAFKPEERSTVKEIWDTCYAKEPHNPDRCEYVFNIVKCQTSAVRAANMEPIPFWNAD